MVPAKLNINNWMACVVTMTTKCYLIVQNSCVDISQFVFNTNVVNHLSAEQFPMDTDAYFNKEINHKAIVGPCRDIPFKVHYPSLLSRPKAEDTIKKSNGYLKFT